MPRSLEVVVKTTVVLQTTIRVRHSRAKGPGITRERRGDEFRYRDAKGWLIRDAEVLRRIKELVIPPAWENVWISPIENAHLQATGFDVRGRKQYRYHPAFRAKQDDSKFENLAAFGRILPKLRRRVAADLADPKHTRTKVLATVVALLDRTHLRVGNEEYVRANESFGLSTLRDDHVTFKDGALRIRFRGKSGVPHDHTVDDPKLAKIVRECRDVPGQELFRFVDDRGDSRRILSGDVNAYLREVVGEPVTAKEFRTWAGTVAAAERLAKAERAESKAALARAVAAVVKEVAAVLGNTPAVCRKSYIHPAVLTAFEKGRFPEAKTVRGLSRPESRLLQLLAPNNSAK